MDTDTTDRSARHTSNMKRRSANNSSGVCVRRNASGAIPKQQPKENPNDGANFVKELCRCFDDLRPIDGTRHGETRPFLFKDLKTTNHVFVRRERPKAMPQPPYDGPFAVVNRNDKNLTICVQKYNGLNRPG